LKKMRVKSGAIGYYNIESDETGFNYLDNKWDAQTLKNYILIVEVVETEDEIPKELYSKAPNFNKPTIFSGYDRFTWARLYEIIDKRTGETNKCDEGIENWYLFKQKYLTSRGIEVSEKDKADKLDTQKIWDEFKCQLEGNLRSMIYGRTGADWCVAVRSECKELRYKGSSYCPCLRPHPSSGQMHCLYVYLKENSLKPDAKLSTKQLYKILGG